MPETKVVEITQAQLLELLLHGSIYEEENDTERKVALRCEVDGTLRNYGLAVGHDGNNQERVQRVDASRILRTRPFEPYVFVAPDDIPAVNTDLYTVPANTLSVVEVEAQSAGVAGTVTIYLRPSGDAAAAANVVVNGIAIAAGSIGFRIGPYVMEAGGIVTAVAAPANCITVHLFVQEYGTGDGVDY